MSEKRTTDDDDDSELIATGDIYALHSLKEKPIEWILFLAVPYTWDLLLCIQFQNLQNKHPTEQLLI